MAVLHLAGLVDLDDLRVIKGSQHTKLVYDVIGCLDVLLLDAFDCPQSIGVILELTLVDRREGPSSDNLR